MDCGINSSFLNNFISPVTGRILCTTGYIIEGNELGIGMPSSSLLDLKIDFIKLLQDFNILIKDFNNLLKSNFIIGFPNSLIPNSQVLSELSNGIMYTTDGIVSTISTIPSSMLPDLTNNHLWRGNLLNRPVEIVRIDISNLPTFSTLNPLLLGGAYNLWTGSPNPLTLGEPTQTLSIQRCNLPSLTKGFLWFGDDITPTDDPLNFGLSRPREIKVLPLDNMADLGVSSNPVYANKGQIWRGTITLRPVPSDDLSALEFDVSIIKNITIPSIQSDIAALQSEISAIQIEIATIQGQITALQAAVALIQGQIIALQAAIAIIQGQITNIFNTLGDHEDRITTLETTVLQIQSDITTLQAAIITVNTRIDNLRLNNIIADNDVSFFNYKLINLADPIAPTDGVNLRTLQSYVSSTNLDLTGDVTGSGPLSSPISTTLELTLDQIKKAQNTVDVNNQRIKNLNDTPEEIHDVVDFYFIWELIHGRVNIILG